MVQWEQVWSAYELVTRLNEQTDEYRVAVFITCIGPKALTILTFVVSLSSLTT